MRSWTAIAIAPFAVIWNTFLAGIIATAFHSPSGGWGVLAFLSLHLFAGLVLVGLFGCYSAGDVEVRARDGMLTVSTGVGPLRWDRRRRLQDVRSVRYFAQANRPVRCLVLDCPRPLRFGMLLNSERRSFLHAAIQEKLRQ